MFAGALHDAVSNIYPRTVEDSAWSTIKSESTAWSIMQQSLDTFVQRVSVAESQTQKQALRVWYEGLLEIGQKLFGI
jgi:hypothetical protein